MNLRIVVIVGPTACGKTRLGVEVAHRAGGEIISADSRQVYRGLDLGTGKDLHEYSSVDPPVPYHLIDVADPADVYTVFQYQRDCYEVLLSMAGESSTGADSLLPIMVGGSGLYVEAVLRQYRIADVPEDAELRRGLRGRSRRELEARLEREAPELAAETDRSSRKRLIRGLEISAARRRGPVASSRPLGHELRSSVFGVRVARDELRKRIANRVRARFDQGMMAEVEDLLAAGLSTRRLDMLGLEYREIGAYLAGAVSYDEMVEQLIVRIGQFAKRQQTYFRGMERRGIPIRWIEAGDWQTVLEALRPRGRR